MPFKARKAVFDKLLEVADVANLSKDERVLYDEALKRYRDYKNTIDYAEEKGIEKGMEKGIKIGEAKGLAKGLAKGKAEGRAEGLAKGKAQEQRQIAANLKTQGVDIETIAQCTGLSVEEISQL